jgi:O-antigen ligase
MLPVAIVASVVLVLAPIVVPGTVSQLREQFSSSNTTAERSIGARTADYGAISPDIQAHTLVGRGYATYDPTRYRYLDNQYLESLIGTGVIGTGFYVMMMLVVGATALKLGRRSTGDRAWIGLAAAGAVLAFAVSNALFDTLSFAQAPYAFFLVAALVAILARTVGNAGVR